MDNPGDTDLYGSGASPPILDKEEENSANKEDDVQPHDSVSNISRTSSALSKERILNLKHQIQLKMELETLREKQAIEREQTEIQRRNEELNRQKEELSIQMQLRTSHEINRMLEQEDPEVCFKPSLLRVKLDECGADRQSSVSLSNGGASNTVNRDQNSDNNLVKILNKLIDNQKEQSLPAQDIQSFDGKNVLDYLSFVQNFKYVVENNTNDAVRRLELLLKYTRGEARELIKQCPMIMPPERAYDRARELLKRDYGNELIIAAAFKNQAKEWTDISAGDKVGLRKFSLFLTNCVNTKQANKDMSSMDGYEFTLMLATKLPTSMQTKWIQTVGHIREKEKRSTKLEDLEQFVGLISRNENDPTVSGLGYQHHFSKRNQPTNNPHSLKNTNKISSNQVSVNTSENLALKSPCLYCGNQTHHAFADCKRFGRLSEEEKNYTVMRLGLCFGCANPGHIKAKCPNRDWAKCEKCPRSHSTVLHDPRRDTQKSESLSNSNKDKPLAAEMKSVTSGGLQLETNPLMAIVPVKVKAKSNDYEISTYAFVDNGCGAVFADEKLAHELKVRTKTANVMIKTMNLEKCENMEIVIDDLQISEFSKNNYLDVPIVYVKDKLPLTMADVPKQCDLEPYRHLKDIVLPKLEGECVPRVSMVIGSNFPAATIPLEIKMGEIGEPYAIRSPLGWLIYGVPGKLINANTVSMNFCEVDNNLEKQLRAHFNLEFSEKLCEDTKSLSIEDKQFLDIMDKSVNISNNHYETKLPFRERDNKMPNNKLQAELFSGKLRHRLIKNHDMCDKYSKFMCELETKGYCEKVPISELQRCDGRVWYLNHHNVKHPKKPEKVRVVFNCPLVYKDKSLNDELIQGPDLTNKMMGVLLRWRQEYIAMTGDIEAMFYQVRVEKNDCDMMRFLWWPDGNLNSPLTEYRMLVHLFGAVSSPSCANYALRRAATDNISNYRSEVIASVLNDFYVDDFLKSVKSDSDAINLIKDISELLKQGGFNLTKWVSNSRQVLNTIPESSKVEEVKNLDLTSDSLPVKRALGVQWCTETDNLEMNISEMNSTATRRNVLSVMSSVYDPYGICAPFVLQARIILQELCREGLTWDEPIPVNYKIMWDNWLSDLPNLTNVKVSRCVKPKNFGNIVNSQMHHFVDASQSGYGTVTYIRFTNDVGQIHCSFLMGRSRVAPIKTHTIVKLELAAASSAVKQNNMLKREMTLPVDCTYFWTDSQTVLKYIRNEKTRHQVFVANRIEVIRDGSSINDWRYVPSKLNCADHASRGLSTSELLTTNWLTGPDFLKQPDSEWPDNFIETCNENNNAIEVCALKISDQSKQYINKLFEHYSDWHKLKRAVAWLLRFKTILYLKSKSQEVPKDKISGVLKLADIQNAEQSIIKFVQLEHYREEIQACEQENAVKINSNISNLDPIIQNGLLCVGGRLRNAKIPDRAKHQYILPKNSHISNLIVRHSHYSVLHQGRNHTLAQLRQKYWIVKAGVLVKNLVNKCVICRRQNQRRGVQKMASLPASRLRPDEFVFSSTGLDFFGPIEVKVGRSIKKRYGVIFTCMTSRAIHIEVAESLDTSSCIEAIRRFMARRGAVNIIHSDNGTNLVGSFNELKEFVKGLNQTRINNFLSNRGVQWIFNPPTASHYGGIWERQIRTIRKIMQSVLCEQFVKTNQGEEQLRTLLCEIEAVVNSRPLTRVSEDSSDLEVITPNSLLLLRPMSDFPLGLFNEKEIYSKRRWRQVQYLADLFWRRWTKEYMSLLQTRTKWTQPQKNFAVDDIVLIVDDSAPRGSWPMGRIVETYPDKHGHVRSVKLKTKTTYLVRPISKLCLLLEQDI